MNITFRQLQTFREVMRQGSVSAAARAIGRTQPSVSAALANLEQELGFDLFLREKGRVIAKPEAHYFLEEAQTMLDRMAQTARMMREIGDLDKGQLRVACLPAASNFFLPNVLAEFVGARPDVTASLVTRSSSLIEELIASQQFDIGLSETPEPRSTIEFQEFHLKCVCAIHHQHPLAGKGWVTPDDLDGLPQATLSRDHPILIQTKQAFAEAGARFNQRFELQISQPALSLVEQGLCFSICDLISAESYRSYRRTDPKIAFVPFYPETLISTSILTPSQRPQSLLAEAFEAHLTNAMRELQKASFTA